MENQLFELLEKQNRLIEELQSIITGYEKHSKEQSKLIESMKNYVNTQGEFIEELKKVPMFHCLPNAI